MFLPARALHPSGTHVTCTAPYAWSVPRLASVSCQRAVSDGCWESDTLSWVNKGQPWPFRTRSQMKPVL